MTTTPEAAAHAAHELSPRFRTYPQLLELAAADGVYRRLAANLPQLRARYCGITSPGAGHASPCLSCGSLSSVLVGGVPLHPGCFDPSPQALAAAADPAAAGPQQSPQPAGPGAEPAPGARPSAKAGAEHLAAVLSGDGLWLPGATSPIAVPWPRHAGEAYALAAEYYVRQLWIHPSAHQHLGIPAEHAEPNPQAPQPHAWTSAPGFSCDPPGLAAWVNVQAAGQPEGQARRRALVFPAYERADRANWKPASTGWALLAAVGEYNALMPRGCNYYYSPNVTSAAVIRHHNRGKLTVTEAPPPAAGRIAHVRRWSRILTSDEDGAEWLHEYDVNAQQLAVWNTKLGTGPAEHLVAPQWAPQCRRMPGYWLTRLPEQWRPDPLLPDLLIPWQRSGEDAVWLPTPYLELLDEFGAPLAIDEAWIWRTSSAWLEAPGKTFRQARAALTGRDDEPARVARTVMNQTWRSRIGAFAPHDPQSGRVDELYRPDATDMIISKAFCNDYRRMRKIGAASGRWPVAIYADAAFYTADDPDPYAAAPAGLTLGSDLGQYKPEATIPLRVVAGNLGEPSFQAAVNQFLKGPN